MTDQRRDVTGGVDTHPDQHVAAVVDSAGRILATEAFLATAAGYGRLLAWMRRHGRVVKVGVEGTGSYGAGLARYVAVEAVEVVEVNRPNRQTRTGTVTCSTSWISTGPLPCRLGAHEGSGPGWSDRTWDAIPASARPSWSTLK